MREEEVGVGQVGGLGGGAEGFGHYFCLAEKEAFWSAHVSYGTTHYRMYDWSDRVISGHIPAVREVRADLLEEGVAHVVDGEDEAVLVGVEAFLDGREELEGQLLALFVDLREVNDLGAFGFRHGRWWCGVGGGVEVY